MEEQQYPPRRPTQGYEAAVITPESRVGANLKGTMWLLGVAIAATFTAAGTYFQLRQEVKESATKEDVREIGHKVDLVQITTRNQVDGLFQKKVKRFLMTCPREVLRSNSREIICPAVLLREDSE